MKRCFRRALWVSASATGLLLLLFFLLPFPPVSRLSREAPGKTGFMAFREREWKAKGKKATIRQIWVPLTRISPYLVKAVLIAEDDKFWHHDGFDLEAIRKALEKDIRARRFKAGGSTLTQQLARNLFLSPEKSLLRKAAEAALTWKMEQALSKKRILELYLNVAEWGEGIFGAEAAARHYFGKPAAELDPREAARLAAALPNPRRFDPGGNQRYLLARSELIYGIMMRRGIVLSGEEPEGAETPLSGKRAAGSPDPAEEEMGEDE